MISHEHISKDIHLMTLGHLANCLQKQNPVFVVIENIFLLIDPGQYMITMPLHIQLAMAYPWAPRHKKYSVMSMVIHNSRCDTISLITNILLTVYIILGTILKGQTEWCVLSACRHAQAGQIRPK